VTHDELIDTLERHQNSYIPDAKDVTAWDALKAVVELHTQDRQDCCPICLDFYPCPTIQAIEKELG
jgi:hypothetical protein